LKMKNKKNKKKKLYIITTLQKISVKV